MIQRAFVRRVGGEFCVRVSWKPESLNTNFCPTYWSEFQWAWYKKCKHQGYTSSSYRTKCLKTQILKNWGPSLFQASNSDSKLVLAIPWILLNQMLQVCCLVITYCTIGRHVVKRLLFTAHQQFTRLNLLRLLHGNIMCLRKRERGIEGDKNQRWARSKSNNICNKHQSTSINNRITRHWRQPKCACQLPHHMGPITINIMYNH